MKKKLNGQQTNVRPTQIIQIVTHLIYPTFKKKKTLQIQKKKTSPPDQYKKQLKNNHIKKVLTHYDKSQTYVNNLFHQKNRKKENAFTPTMWTIMWT